MGLHHLNVLCLLRLSQSKLVDETSGGGSLTSFQVFAQVSSASSITAGSKTPPEASVRGFVLPARR